MARIGSVTINSRDAVHLAAWSIQQVIEDGKTVVAEFRLEQLEQYVYRANEPICPGSVFCATRVRYRRVA